MSSILKNQTSENNQQLKNFVKMFENPELINNMGKKMKEFAENRDLKNNSTGS